MEMSKMYVNTSNKLCYKDRLRIVKQRLAGHRVTTIAKNANVSRQTIYVVLANFREHDVYGLEDHRPGARRQTLHPTFHAKVVELRQKNGWGACRIEHYFRKLGFSVSHNRIHAVITMENLTYKKLGKRTRPKYIRYEAEHRNDQWHMDWSIDPLTKKQLLAIIDDKTRFVVFSGLFNSANAENTCIGLEKAIVTYGAPKELVTDNGSHFKNIHKKQPCEPLLCLEKKHNIKHIFIRVGHPESNGKIERLFGSYKIEFARMNNPDVKDCLTWMHFYNYERPHQSLNYKTPAQMYLGVNRI